MKNKKHHSGIISIQIGGDIGREREKNFSLEFRSYTTPTRKFQKKSQKNSKNQKTSFRHYFYPNWDEIGREREEKIVVANSIPTRPGK